MPTHKKIAKAVGGAVKRVKRGTPLVGKSIARAAKTATFGAFKSRGGRLLPPKIKISNVRRTPKREFKKKLKTGKIQGSKFKRNFEQRRKQEAARRNRKRR